jgi:hypothetical protein
MRRLSSGTRHNRVQPEVLRAREVVVEDAVLEHDPMRRRTSSGSARTSYRRPRLPARRRTSVVDPTVVVLPALFGPSRPKIRLHHRNDSPRAASTPPG